jgi:hypothetical protein
MQGDREGSHRLDDADEVGGPAREAGDSATSIVIEPSKSGRSSASGLCVAIGWAGSALSSAISA